ncbi:hypothetical protein GCM10011321_17460 [Youhaiella tibetensis]|uniref:Cytochrome c n=1 Tax=Paradevosia tibetensis TaxID=1447062 RepID=A0A5B9DN92_9HYPH|nr:cytochrome c [Youhaiella tibetensis]AKR55066.1 hypothetical protein XM25_04423 [Devosia sp. H5989]QEE20169.1 cytochrome c [Youhaiella tibetensis]GGF26540.1 hypothetical protein GCM10011321_17460 [Youhaiella tibetensis]
MQRIAKIIRVAAMTAAAVLAASSVSSVASAQDAKATYEQSQVDAGFKVFKGSDCAGCHGWAGNGQKIGENPDGPSLRSIDMDDAVLKETILCGRPGTNMPSHDPKAYTDDRCYGMDAAAAEGMTPHKGKPMTSDQADDLVAYIQTELVGKSDKPTLEECQKYYGKKPVCNAYK